MIQSTLTAELTVFFTAMLPFLDMKLAIPVGMELGLSSTTSVLIATIGSILPAAIFLAVIGPIAEFARKFILPLDIFLQKLFNKTRKQHTKRFNRYGSLAVIAFIAVPLPGSGSIAGSLIAFIFGVKYWKSLLIVTIGTIFSGILISSGFRSVTAILDFFIK